MDGRTRDALAVGVGGLAGVVIGGLFAIDGAAPTLSALLGCLFALSAGLTVRYWGRVTDGGPWFGAAVLALVVGSTFGVPWALGTPAPDVSTLVLAVGYTAYVFGRLGDEAATSVR